MNDKDLQQILNVKWKDSKALDLGQKIVTIIGRGRALQKSDAYIMKDIMELFAVEGYGKMVDKPITKILLEYNDVTKQDGNLLLNYEKVFEPIKVEDENEK
ncbi:MAG: hypothetical protein WC389_22525 [Lutibacter sp.]|jgi:hypothetical protein